MRGLVKAAAVALAASSTLAKEHCPCGLVGVDCAETGFVTLTGAVERVPVTDFVDSNCTDEKRSFGCFVRDEASQCSCRIGFEGRACEGEVQLNVSMQLIAGVAMPLAGMMLAVYLLFLHLSKDGFAGDYNRNRLDCVEGNGNRVVLLVLRVLFFNAGLFSLVLQALDAPRGVGFELRFFSTHCFILAVVYFGLGFYLSVRAVWGLTPSSSPLNRTERVFYVLMEVLVPVTAMVTVMVWALFFPLAEKDGRSGLLLTRSSYARHGLNLVALCIDYALNGLRFTGPHVHFGVLLVAAYQLFHSALMFVDSAQGLPHAPAYDFLLSTDPLYPVWVLLVALLVVAFYNLFLFLDRFNFEHEVEGDGASAGEHYHDTAVKLAVVRPAEVDI